MLFVIMDMIQGALMWLAFLWVSSYLWPEQPPQKPATKRHYEADPLEYWQRFNDDEMMRRNPPNRGKPHGRD